jgi:hypothetical protein
VANIKEHSENLKEYFPENLTSEFWIRGAFSIEDILPESVTTNEKGEQTGLSFARNLQQMFKKMDFTEFWLQRRNEHQLMTDRALSFLLIFSTTNLCEY